MEGLQAVLNTLRPAVIALIATSGITIFTQAVFQGNTVAWSHINWLQAGIFLLCMYLLIGKKKDPIEVMVLAGLIHVAGSLIIGV